MKHNKLTLYIFLFFSLSSCTKDFLDVKNTQNLYRESYVKDLSSMQEYVNGIYLLLSSKFESGISATSYPELVADNIRPLSTSSPTSMIDHYNWLQRAETNYMSLLWQDGYSIIRSCNFVVEDVDKYRKENSAKADNIKGQALAIRAYIFFKLVNTFAQPYNYTTTGTHPGIPYITTSDITKPYSRQTVSEVYSNIIADLAKAIQLLPAAVVDIRAMNQTAAKALLARMYLFKEDFLNARTLAMEISNQVPLLTIDKGYPNEIFKYKSPNQTETLFQLSPKGGTNRTDFFNRYLQRNPIQFVATGDITNILKENINDIRRNWVTDVSGQWNVLKFPKGAAPEVSPAITIAEIAYYPAIIRSSEMFLIAAESAAKMGDENIARTYIDAIRKRADPSILSITATGVALLDSIYKERRKELAFEGLRLYDLQRCKQDIARMDALPGSPVSLPYPNEKAISPIPVSDVKLAGLPQNSGY